MLTPMPKRDYSKTDRINKFVNVSASIINMKDFLKLKSDIISVEYDQDKRTKEECLRKLSQEKMKKWPDSIEQIKKKELELRKERFFNEELDRRKADDEEEKYQRIKKQMILDNAKKRLFENQESVKSFHSSLILSDCLRERDYQKEIVKKKIEHDKLIDRQWEEVEIKKMKEYDEKEKQKFEEMQQKKGQQMSSINQQFRQFKLKKIREYQDGVVEGQMIQTIAKQALQEDKDKEVDFRNKAIQQLEEFKRDNHELEKIKEKQKLDEIAYLKKIEEYAQKKQDIVDLKLRKEKEKFAEKQRKRQVMIDKQIEYLSNLKNKEEEVLEKQKIESDKKFNDELEDKKKRFNEFKKQMEENRSQVLERKNNAKKAEMEEDKVFIKFWSDRMKELEDEEKKEKQESTNRKINLQDYHKIQIENRKNKAEQEFILTQEEVLMRNKKLQEQDDEFISYAGNLLREYHKEGKDITPLILELKNYKRKIYYGN